MIPINSGGTQANKFQDVVQLTIVKDDDNTDDNDDDEKMRLLVSTK